jgi:hypothetical protein
MAKFTWTDRIQPGHPLWQEGSQIVIGGLRGQRKKEPKVKPAPQPEQSSKTTKEVPETHSKVVCLRSARWISNTEFWY